MNLKNHFVSAHTYTAIICTAILLPIATLAYDGIIGISSVTDGDTLQIHGKKIRLHGIDAPETRQPCAIKGKPYRCGQKAALALDELIAGKTIHCEAVGVDRYKRTVAICYIGDLDVNAWMVENGWALAYRKYSEDYVESELLAKNRQLGIWAGKFEEPWVYRKQIKSKNHN